MTGANLQDCVPHPEFSLTPSAQSPNVSSFYPLSILIVNTYKNSKVSSAPFLCHLLVIDEPKSIGLYLLNAGHKQVHISVSIN